MPTRVSVSPADARLYLAFTAPGGPDWRDVRAAILAGANPNAPSVRRVGQTLLTHLLRHHTAAAPGMRIIARGQYKKTLTRMRWLLEHDANPSLRDANGDLPLHIAIRCSWLDAFDLLVATGADLEARDSKGWPPLARAVQGNHHMVITLLERRIDPNDRTQRGESMLMIASKEPSQATRAALFSLLLAAGADPARAVLYGERTLPEYFASIGRQDLIGELDDALQHHATAGIRARLLDVLSTEQSAAWLPKSCAAHAAIRINQRWVRQP